MHTDAIAAFFKVWAEDKNNGVVNQPSNGKSIKGTHTSSISQTPRSLCAVYVLVFMQIVITTTYDVDSMYIVHDPG